MYIKHGIHYKQRRDIEVREVQCIPDRGSKRPQAHFVCLFY